MPFPSISTIKHRRKILNLSQKELAKNLELSQSLIAKLESGKINTSYDVAAKIFNFLDESEKKHEKSCEQIMKKNVISLSPSDKIEHAISILKKYSISQIPILKNEFIVGSLSENKIYDLLMKEGKEIALKKQIEEIMEEPFPTLSKNSPFSSAAGLLKYSNAVILLNKNKICGIITKSDLL